ncbi:MAG TPA: hypothetical protein VMF59_10690 [Bacteroidota bacterium]|nr:hypothetical protein [Bacteroidota bacterium]
MKLVYMCFVSNGFDDHYRSLVCSSMNAGEFLTGVVKEYGKAAALLNDAAAPYFIALNLDTLKATSLGLFKLEKDGKIFAPTGRGQFSGKPADPDDIRERAEQMLNE